MQEQSEFVAQIPPHEKNLTWQRRHLAGFSTPRAACEYRNEIVHSPKKFFV